MYINQRKKFAAELSIGSNITLTALKIFAGIFSGSISIISEAIHSASDLFASLLTYFSVSKSAQPADDDHPYGHGKYEDMAGFIEGLLIVFAAIFIVFEATKKIVFGLPVQLENNFGILVMAFAAVLNIFTSSYLLKIAKESGSISLYADGEHLRTDVYSSLGVFIGLILIKYTGHYVLDPIIAILVAMFIYRTGYSITKRAWMHLVDHSLSENEIDGIKSVIAEFADNVKLKENGIKARQVGPTLDIDLILQFPEQTTICECHKICDEIEKKILARYINSSISIHSEPLCYNSACQRYCKYK